MTELRGLFLFLAKNRLDKMMQVFDKIKSAKRADCNLRQKRIATLAAGAKATRFGALLVLHTPKKSTFGSRYTVSSPNLSTKKN